MLKILYKRYYREVYILYLLFCILYWFLLWYFWQDNNFCRLLLTIGSIFLIFFIFVIPAELFPKTKWRKSYGNKECKNKCIVISGHFYTWESKCEHCKYCPHSVHKYQHKIFKHMRIFKNKFLGW